MAVGPRRGALVDWVLVALMSLLTGVIAVFGVFFVPAYRGSTPVPLAIVAVALAVAGIPRLTYGLTGRMPAAMAPVLVWAVVTIGLYITPNALYQGVPVAWQRWQFLLLVGVGALAAAVSIGLLWGDHLRLQLAAADPDQPHDVRA